MGVLMPNVGIKVSDGGIGGIVDELLTVTINQKAGQLDPGSGEPILFEAIFSEEVVGFSGTDVTLSGTAGATVAALSSLDDITFTVGVSGMTSNGTVIASIDAAVCTGVGSGLPNEASSSTDNTVTYIEAGTGLVWGIVPSAADFAWTSVCWSPELSMFAAVAATDGATQRAMTSPDGIGWTIRTTPNFSFTAIAWSPSLGLFCAVANSGTTQQAMTSPDGITWTIRTTNQDRNWAGIAWSPSLGMFAAVANLGTGNRVMTSTNGTSWTARAASNDTLAWNDVCWSPDLGMFVAVADGAGSTVMTSTNGTSWTGRTAAGTFNWNSVCWSPELGLFAAVADTGVSAQVMTSPDGINWTGRTTSGTSREWNSICWAPEVGLFVAVADSNATAYQVMTSPDGLTWTLGNAALPNLWNDVCYSPELIRFVAVGRSGTGTRVMISPTAPVPELDGALPEAIFALNALSYWPLVDGNLNDYGTLNQYLTAAGSFTTVAGPDGMYPKKADASVSSHYSVPDNTAYEPQTSGGLTVVFLMLPNDTSSTAFQWPVSKYTGATNGRSWYVGAQNDNGLIMAATSTSGGSLARARSVIGAFGQSSSAWRFVAVRFSSSSTGYPAVSVEGSNFTGTTSGSGTAQADGTGIVSLFAQGNTGGLFTGALGHVAIFAGQLSDGDLATLEAASALDGWVTPSILEFADLFNRANESPVVGYTITGPNITVAVVSNQLVFTKGATSSLGISAQPTGFQISGSNGYVEADFSNLTTTYAAALIMRGSSVSTADGYFAGKVGTNWQLRHGGISGTIIGTVATGTLSGTYTVRLECEGSNIRMYLNGALLHSGVNTTYTGPAGTRYLHILAGMDPGNTFTVDNLRAGTL